MVVAVTATHKGCLPACVQLRMNYEINRQLQRDNDLSLADYHVLCALSIAPNRKLQAAD
jgi:hypothetical protein